MDARYIDASRDERSWWVQLKVWLGMLAICSPAGLVAVLVAIAGSPHAGPSDRLFGGLGIFAMITLGAWAVAALAASAANPRYNNARPDVGEFAKGLALAPLWILASGVRLAISFFIGVGIAGLLLVGWRAL